MAAGVSHKAHFKKKAGGVKPRDVKRDVKMVIGEAIGVVKDNLLTKSG